MKRHSAKLLIYFTVLLTLLLADRLALIRQERAEAAKKREEEKTGTWLIFFSWFSSMQFLCYIMADFVLLFLGFSLQPKNRRSWKLANNFDLFTEMELHYVLWLQPDFSPLETVKKNGTCWILYIYIEDSDSGLVCCCNGVWVSIIPYTCKSRDSMNGF